MTEKKRCQKETREGVQMLLGLIRNPLSDKKEEETLEEQAIKKILGPNQGI